MEAEPEGSPDDRVDEEGGNERAVELGAGVRFVDEFDHEDFGEEHEEAEAAGEGPDFAGAAREEFRLEGPEAEGEDADERESPGAIEDCVHARLCVSFGWENRFFGVLTGAMFTGIVEETGRVQKIA